MVTKIEFANSCGKLLQRAQIKILYLSLCPVVHAGVRKTEGINN